MTTTQTTTILASRMVPAVKMLQKFAKKAAKYGVEFGYSAGDIYTQERERSGTCGRKTYTVNVLDITITGDQPKVGNYKFLASVEFTPAGNFVDTVPGVKVPVEYRTTNDRCEHCNKDRKRNQVFVVRNTDTDEITQVGRTCLRDFLGTDDPKAIIDRFTFYRLLSTFDADEGWDGFGSGSYWADDLRRVLAITTAVVRLRGWVSKGAAYNNPNAPAATVDIYWIYTAKTDKWNMAIQDEIRAEIGDDDFTYADNIIDWVRGTTDDSDYMHNLRIAFADDVVTSEKRMGLIASSIVAYHRHLDKEIKRAERAEKGAESGFVGEVKQRLDFELLVVGVYGSEGYYGWVDIVKMQDKVGNLFTWFASNSPRLEHGDRVALKGTVKKHDTYRGVKSTVLTRCNFTKFEVVAADDASNLEAVA